MAAGPLANCFQHQIASDEASICLLDDCQSVMRTWDFSKQEIEDFSPSREDGIDYEEESHVRKLYCSLLQELGIELKVPQVTIATAMVLCHRFYMRQSHAKNDWQTIATASMFLACKAEETPRWLTDLVSVAYKLIYRWDPSAPKRIRRKEVYDKQKELILIGERLLLASVAFDLNIEHPYRPLVAALKGLDITHKELVKVSWNFVNDWIRTTLCLQHKPHYIAAGSMFLAAKFLKVKLPCGHGKAWWMQFDVSPQQLEGVIKQMRELLEHNRKQTVLLKPRKMTESEPGNNGESTSVSPESCISNGSVVVQDSSELAKSSKACSNDVHKFVKGKSSCQTSDCGSRNSIVEDGDDNMAICSTDQVSVYKIVSAGGSYSKVDASRIRETLKRRRCVGFANKNSVEDGDFEIDSEAWIEKELENGLESQAQACSWNQRF